MADYTYYTETYQGTGVDEETFNALAPRAQDYLAQFGALYKMTPYDGDDERAYDMSVCAMVDALDDAQLTISGASGEGTVSSAKIGEVSVSYDASAMRDAVDVTPTGIRRSLLRACQLYYNVYTGLA